MTTTVAASPAAPRKPLRLLGLREVEHLTSLSKANIYRKINDGTFPVPVQVSKGRVGWHHAEIDAWIASRPRAAIIVVAAPPAPPAPKTP